MLPFVIVETVIVLYIFVAYFFGSGMLTTPLRTLIISGGVGPGSYYVWIYLQFALILLPLFGWLRQKVHLSDIHWGIIFILISEGLEILCSYWNPNNWIYRLLSFRYVFLVYGGYLWAKHGVKCNWKTIILSIISLIAIYTLQYRHYTFEPWIFDTPWCYFHWCCYFFVMFLLVLLVNLFYKIGGVFTELIKTIGKYSYEIFLFQMLVFYWFPSEINKWTYLIATTLLSIVPVLVYYRIKTKWQIIN